MKSQVEKCRVSFLIYVPSFASLNPTIKLYPHISFKETCTGAWHIKTKGKQSVFEDCCLRGSACCVTVSVQSLPFSFISLSSSSFPCQYQPCHCVTTLGPLDFGVSAREHNFSSSSRRLEERTTSEDSLTHCC